MPSYPEGSMNLNSGVGDNAAGRYFGGSRRGGGSMFANNRQMRQYMQMRRDEMSHGAFLQNQNNDLAAGREAAADERGSTIREREADTAFNRESLRTDANVQQNDWQKGRNTFHLGEVRKTDPNVTSYKTDGNSFSFGAEPGLHPTGRAAEERFREMQESGNPLVTPQKVQSQRTDVPGQGAIGAPPVRAALGAPAAKAARAPRARREPGYVQQTLPGMRNTRQFKDTTLPPSTGSAATSTPITSGNETAIK